jgi:hypothetical protein
MPLKAYRFERRLSIMKSGKSTSQKTSIKTRPFTKRLDTNFLPKIYFLGSMTCLPR